MWLCKNLSLHSRKDRGDHGMEKEEQKQKRLPHAQRKHGDPYELDAGERLSGKA